MATSEIEYRRIEQMDKDSISKIVMDIFVKTEVAAVKLNWDGQREGRKFAAIRIRKGLCDRVSVVAIDRESGQIVGFILNSVEDKANYALELQEEIADATKKMVDFDIVLGQVSGNIDYFKRFKVDKIFNFSIACVLPDYQGRGIFKSLVYKSMQIWEEMGIPLGKVVASNFFTRRIFKELGFDLFAEKRYDEIILHGKPFIEDEKVHTTLSIWTKIVKPNGCNYRFSKL